MKEVQIELMRNPILPDFAKDILEREIATIVWKKFYEARDAGKFRIKVWIFSKDVSGIVADLLLKWFGPDPALR
jgi:hypothetical protein